MLSPGLLLLSFFFLILQIAQCHLVFDGLFLLYFFFLRELLLLLYNINRFSKLLNALRNACMLRLQYHSLVNE